MELTVKETTDIQQFSPEQTKEKIRTHKAASEIVETAETVIRRLKAGREAQP